MPRFSVIIPSYNASKTLSCTLKSCLNQSFHDFEVILIDDCSNDDTEQICLKFSERFKKAKICFRYFRLEKNHGVSYARNFGWNNALGDYVCFLDSDDIWHRSKLQAIDFHIDNFILTCLFHSYTDDLSYFNRHCNLRPGDFQLIRKNTIYFLFRNPSQTSCFVVKTDVDYRFNEKMSFCEDYDLWLRISLKEPVYALIAHPLTLLGRPQLSLGGLSSSRLKMRKGEMAAYFNICREIKGFYVILPALLLVSILKHIKSEILLALRKLLVATNSLNNSVKS
jgi:teichuronic acid biosynthesis glycosyltransferase TuaG